MLRPPVRHLVGDPAEIAFEPHVVSGLRVEEPRIERVREQQGGSPTKMLTVIPMATSRVMRLAWSGHRPREQASPAVPRR
jgi:hypothetical protein